MNYYLKRTGAGTYEAEVSIEDGCVTLHSRSGRARSDPPGKRGRNPDYVAAFDAIFDRINDKSVAVERVLLDSVPAHALPEQRRILASRNDFEVGALHVVKSKIRAQMRGFGRSPNMPANEGNQNKKIRIDTNLADKEIVRRLRAVPTTKQVNVGAPATVTSVATLDVLPIPAAQLRRIQRADILHALARLDAGDPASNFVQSRDYDVLTGDGRIYPPKKVFGLALEAAFGIEAKPGHFNAGWGTPCFDILEECDLWIVPKSEAALRPRPVESKLAEALGMLIATEEEKAWIEGNPRIAVHLARERQSGLSAMKRDEFIAKHGKLSCERCDLDPVAIYGRDAGHACIEVHHHRTHVADMQPGHETSLEDLKCLCSNCHRVLHRALSLGLPFDV